MLPQIVRGRAESLDEVLELSAAIFIVPEHVETCETRTQQNVAAGISEFRSSPYRFREIRTARMRHSEGRAVKGEFRTRLANQHRMLHVRRDAMHEAREIAAFRFSAGNQNDRRVETRECSLDRMK